MKFSKFDKDIQAQMSPPVWGAWVEINGNAGYRSCS